MHIYRAYSESFANYNLQQAINACFEIVSNSDKLIQERQPFKKIKTDKEGGEKDIKELLARLNIIAKLLIPFMPETSNKIVELIKNNKMPATPIFIRK